MFIKLVSGFVVKCFSVVTGVLCTSNIFLLIYCMLLLCSVRVALYVIFVSESGARVELGHSVCCAEMFCVHSVCLWVYC